MKTIILSAVATILFSIVNLSAANTQKVYSNIEKTETGCVKEFITYDEAISKAISKSVYHYDANGNMQKKVSYVWDSKAGWEAVNKYDYVYNNSGNVDYLTYTEWDNNMSSWSSKIEQFIHVYDNQGGLLVVKHIKIDNNGEFMAQK